MNLKQKIDCIKAIIKGKITPNDLEVKAHIFIGCNDKWNYDNEFVTRSQMEQIIALQKEKNQAKQGLCLPTDNVVIIVEQD
jgi:hypothetical protein